MAVSQLERLRGMGGPFSDGSVGKGIRGKALTEMLGTGVAIATSSPEIEAMHQNALLGLLGSTMVPRGSDEPVLYEGIAYPGCWLESTGTISAERLDRFCPSVSEATYRLFADRQRGDGLMPFAAAELDMDPFGHLQIVTPLARSVWNHYRMHGGTDFLATMYVAMSRYDEWVAEQRDTRATGCVEAFCVWDTGHDMSPRFWHAPDCTLAMDAAICPDSATLPYLAPDMTAHAYAQRKYLGIMARELGLPWQGWEAKAAKTRDALMANCYDARDKAFYDRDRSGQFVRVQSDVLLRVAACEVIDSGTFVDLLRGYLLNTRKFFARYPLTSIALDDPRFSQDSARNSWAGPTNLLTLLRAPHAFEYYGHHVELTWVMQPAVFALSRGGRFPQTLNPWTGEAGFSDGYTPAMLCYLDFLERLCGILPTPEGELWFTGLSPIQYEGAGDFGREVACRRDVDGQRFESLVDGGHLVVTLNGSSLYEAPKGVRLVTGRNGELRACVGMSVGRSEGTISYGGDHYSISIAGNEVQRFADGAFTTVADPGVVMPTT